MTSAESMFDLAPKIMMNLDYELSGKKITIATLCRLLNGKFNGDIKFVTDYDPAVDTINVGGLYDISSDIPMHIFICAKNKSFKFEINKYPSLTFLLAQVIRHEAIHEYQYSVMQAFPERARYKSPIRNYYDSFVEIDAYSHDIAMELYFFYGYDRAVQMIKSPNKIRKSVTYNLYRKAFRGTNWYQTRKPLLKKVHRWLDVVSKQFEINLKKS